MKYIKPNYLIFAFLIIGCQSRQKGKSAFEILQGASTEVNKRCPIQVDSVLKLHSSLALPPSTFRYNYTLKFDTVKYDIREFKKSFRITTLNTLKTNPDGKMFRDLFTTLIYNFSDTLGNYLFRVEFKPEEYR